jgi:response regulator of citrate/malate metabolism
VHLQAYVIEDNATIRENLVGTLEELTCVRVAGSSATEDEALVWLEGNSERWDLVIVDLFLK